MGPNLLLDKSSLQSISRTEAAFLFKHYNFVLSPILIAEILGDVEKKPASGALPRDEVKWFAQKILTARPYLCAPRQKLCVASLLGNHVPMELGQVPLEHGTSVRGPDGKRGILFDEPPEMKALRAWAAGNFSEAERALSARWRETTRGLDLEKYKKVFASNLVNFRPVKSLPEIKTWIDRFLAVRDADTQLLLLSTATDASRLVREYKTEIHNRWIRAGFPLLTEFAPYAAYCLRVDLFFHIGLASELITTRATNRIDLIHMYYLPFCMAFSSGDQLHLDLAPVLMRENQMLISRDDLKSDLRWLVDEWTSLSEQQQRERSIEYGSHPPEGRPESATVKAWKKFCKPRSGRSGNLVSTLTPKQVKEITDKIEGFLDAAKRAKDRHDEE